MKCNHCYNRIPWVKYWSFDHECFYKLASYSYDDDDDDDNDLKHFYLKKILTVGIITVKNAMGYLTSLSGGTKRYGITHIALKIIRIFLKIYEKLML